MAGILLYSIFFLLLLYLSVIDIRTGVVPHSFVLVLLGLAILSAFSLPQPGILSRLLGLVAVSVPLLLISMLTDGFGGGDIKLYAVCGLMLGARDILLAFWITIVLAAIFGAIFIKIKQKPARTQIAFVPFIATGVMVASLFGNRIINWYLNLF